MERAIVELKNIDIPPSLTKGILCIFLSLGWSYMLKRDATLFTIGKLTYVSVPAIKLVARVRTKIMF